MATDETAEAVLIAHQRHRGGCLCGWSDLGKSHPGHQVAMLRAAALLAEGIADLRAALAHAEAAAAEARRQVLLLADGYLTLVNTVLTAEPGFPVDAHERIIAGALAADAPAVPANPTALSYPSYRAFLGESPCNDPNCPCHPKTTGKDGGIVG